MRVYVKKYYADNPKAHRAYKIRKAYGIGYDQFEKMLAAQNGRCAICRSLPKVKFLSVDHCHKTGTVRGLLCDDCNRGLGLFRDIPARMRAAAKYIESSRKSSQPNNHVFEFVVSP